MTIRLTLAAAALALSAPAFAATDPVDTATIEYADLDLSSARDVNRLERRIDRAAKQVCGEVPALDLWLHRRVTECQANAVAQASAALQPVLAAAGADTRLARSFVSRAR